MLSKLIAFAVATALLVGTVGGSLNAKTSKAAKVLQIICGILLTLLVVFVGMGATYLMCINAAGL